MAGRLHLWQDAAMGKNNVSSFMSKGMVLIKLPVCEKVCSNFGLQQQAVILLIGIIYLAVGAAFVLIVN